MASIFLSPSAQEFNPYAGGGNEEYYMNLLADALEPYLTAAGIRFARNNPQKPFTDAVRLSNQGQYDLHLALHSNAAPPSQAGQVRGSQVYYFPGSERGRQAAETVAEGLKAIYPLPSLVKTVPTVALGEIIRTKAPAILIEVAYHDNPEDAQWIRDNIDVIARRLAQSIGAFLGVPIPLPQERTGVVTTEGGRLNLRTEPTVSADVRTRIPNGTVIPLTGEENGWYLTQYNGMRGYVRADYVKALNE